MGRRGEDSLMNASEFRDSVKHEIPPEGLTPPLAALWWDAKGDWTQAHRLVDELERRPGGSGKIPFLISRIGHSYYTVEDFGRDSKAPEHCS